MILDITYNSVECIIPSRLEETEHFFFFFLPMCHLPVEGTERVRVFHPALCGSFKMLAHPIRFWLGTEYLQIYVYGLLNAGSLLLYSEC